MSSSVRFGPIRANLRRAKLFFADKYLQFLTRASPLEPRPRRAKRCRIDERIIRAQHFDCGTLMWWQLLLSTLEDPFMWGRPHYVYLLRNVLGLDDRMEEIDYVYSV
jgi:hypothetical protein